jgi:uncharacterized protein (TIGR04255 family)
LTDTPTKAYSHPPITEAVIELRVHPEVSQNEQEKIVRRLNKDYPHSQQLSAFNVNIDTTPTGSGVIVSQQPQGFRLTSNDQTNIVIVSPQSVASSRLAPYPGWDAFCGQAIAVWKVWNRSTKTHTVRRVGVRYINRIDIPLDDSDHIRLEDYLTFYPHTPEIGTSPGINYLVQITRATHKPMWIATITSTIVPSPLLKHMSILHKLSKNRHCQALG